MRMCNLSKTLSITAPENVSVGKRLPKFSLNVLHLLDFLPWHGEAMTEGCQTTNLHMQSQ